MKIIDLDGNAYERGIQQGRAMADAWKDMEKVFFASDLMAHTKPKFVPDWVVKLVLGSWGWRRTRPTMKRLLPAQSRKVDGIAEGLGITKRYAWGIQYMELMFCLSTDSISIPADGGCTQAHATPAATADGRPLMGRNYDFPNMLQPFQIVRRETPTEAGRFATMSVTQVPLIGAHQGLNECGLAVCVNNNRAWKEFNNRGVPYMFLLQEALETCRTTAEAVEFLTTFAERGSAGFFGVMDESGDCRVVEFTAERTSVRKPDAAGVLAQANHFITMTDANLPDDTMWNVPGLEGVKYSASTNARYAAADRLLHEHAGKITVETLKNILSDHSENEHGEGDFFTVCCHGVAGSTLASMIFDIKEKTLWISDGTPCGAEYVKVEFKKR